MSYPLLLTMDDWVKGVMGFEPNFVVGFVVLPVGVRI